MLSEAKVNKILVRLAKNIPISEIVQDFSVSPAIVLDLQARNQEKIEEIRVSLNVRELMREEKLEEALKICEEFENLDNEAVQSQRVTILRKLGRIREAYVICKKCIKRFRKNTIFEFQKAMLLNEMHIRDFEVSSPFGVLACIRNGEMTLEKIQNSFLSDEEKLIVTFAFYEANHYSKKFSLQILKKHLENAENELEKNVLRALKQRVMKKTSFFDLEFYQRLLVYYNDAVLEITMPSYSANEVTHAYQSLPINQQEIIAQRYGQDVGTENKGRR